MMLIYNLPTPDTSNISQYSTNKAEVTFPSEPDAIPGLFGRLYITEDLPWQWTLFAKHAGDDQDIADYLLNNRIDVDEEISSAINKYFWDF